MFFLEVLRGCPRLLGAALATEKERDFGIARTMVAGELGDGLLLRLPDGLPPGMAQSLDWRKLELRSRDGSASRVGIPVADVVVVHVLVDMRRIRLGGRLLRRRCNEKAQKLLTKQQAETMFSSEK